MSKKNQDKTDEEPKESSEPTHTVEPEAKEIAEEKPKASHKDWLARCWQWLITHKAISIPIAVITLLAILAAVPFTRYTFAGFAVKQSFPVVVLDAETNKPVSSATVTLAGQTAETDNEGRATLRAKVGSQELTVTKKYYDSLSQKVLVPIGKPTSALEVKLQATGRPVPITVINKISKKPAANVTITATEENTEAKTGEDGKTTLVVPADKQQVKVTLNGDGFNNTEVTIQVTSEEVPENTFEVVPSGKIYFLSNASGNIDLIKSSLDGSDRQTVLPGTGKEDRNNTVLLASRDWEHIALLSKRDGGEYAKLFLIETDTDKLTTMDEGEATFTTYGWSGDTFIYSVNRDKKKSWEAERQALKAYNTTTKKITTLAETAAEGDQSNYAYESLDYVYILGEEIAFVKNWSGGCSYYCNATPKTQGKQATINSIRADGSQKKVVKTYNDPYIDARTAEFGEIYLLYEEGGDSKVDEYHDGTIAAISQKADEFYNKTYPTYVISPSGNKTLWSDYRDGKNVFFIGDGNGENGKELGRSDEYTVYGWFTDDYILLTKKNSELYIMPAEGLEGGIEKALKISDYYKPNYYNRGFGYGYGG